MCAISNPGTLYVLLYFVIDLNLMSHVKLFDSKIKLIAKLFLDDCLVPQSISYQYCISYIEYFRI